MGDISDPQKRVRGVKTVSSGSDQNKGVKVLSNRQKDKAKIDGVNVHSSGGEVKR